MFTFVGRAILLSLTVFAAIGCSDDTKYQFGLRGKWQLEQRVLPDGSRLEPPAVSGMYEWYPMSKTRAHVTASISQGKDQIQVSTCTYELSQTGFKRVDYLKIYGGYAPKIGAASESDGNSTEGSLVTDGNGLTLKHADGMTQVYPDITIAGVEDATFTVTFTDGTVDTWRRTLDQLGVVPK